LGRPSLTSSILRLSSRCAERSQAPRHSLFDICVSRSQYPMHSFKPQPPPPAVLCADSLGLMLEAVGDGSLSFLTVPPEAGVVVICWGDNGAIGDRGVIGAPMTEAGGVVVVCAAAAAAGDVTVGPDLDWASAGPPKAETTQHPASNKEQAREILDTCTPPVRSVCLLWSTKATDWRRHGFRRRIGKAD
jgi:hypothetical protein